MPIANTKKTNPLRRYIRGRLEFEITGNRKGAQKIRFTPELTVMMKERARVVAKAFRNSQRKHGIKEAESRRNESQISRRKRLERKAQREHTRQILNPSK